MTPEDLNKRETEVPQKTQQAKAKNNKNGNRKKKPFRKSDFKFIKKLGYGQFGNIYKAREKRRGYLVAIKSISKEKIRKYKMEKSLIKEIKIQYCLDHPNILPLYGFFHDEKHIYLIMEYAEHGQLFDWLKKQPEGRTTEKRASGIIRQILEAFAYMQEKKVIHRDLKLENVLRFGETVKVADFGWSVIANEKRQTYCGTLDYISPEMFGQGQYDEKIDNWAIGILTYELLVGHPPFGQDNKTQIQFPSFVSNVAR